MVCLVAINAKTRELQSQTVVRFQARTWFEAFGNVTGDSAPTIEGLFLYTARPYDQDGDLQNNLNRWYDLSTGPWMSSDPIGLEAGDVNLYRYVFNNTVEAVDPLGLRPPDIAPAGGGEQAAQQGSEEAAWHRYNVPLA